MNKFMWNFTTKLTEILLSATKYISEIRTKWCNKYLEELDQQIADLKE